MDEHIWRETFQSEMQYKGIHDRWDFSVDEHFQAQKGWLQYSLCGFARKKTREIILNIVKMSVSAWKEEFFNKIKESEITDEWKLIVDENLLKGDRGLYYTQHTFGGFNCSKCRHHWKSSKVYILFLMNLNNTSKRGTVKMRIFRQECKTCSDDLFENATITHENIQRVVKNVVTKIQTKFYKQYDPNEDLKPVSSGRSEGPHDKEHCEACKYNLCDWQVQPGENQEDLALRGLFSANALANVCLTLYVTLYVTFSSPINLSLQHPLRDYRGFTGYVYDGISAIAWERVFHRLLEATTGVATNWNEQSCGAHAQNEGELTSTMSVEVNNCRNHID
ncbi:PREDICTED: receptor-transporting protein 2-like [Nanorana parkeri]|uniref:receptor-transporting protein 2-like n=1 Tax=Nanorana parkeri TaxID=125878 RepID=UPI00085442F6|nr:PREDICTED: receptor-transporting protein 2-like [Nanorana parkeri]